MLDVHAPEHTPHGARDFAIHLLTITAGLLIALALEGAVEWAHHRHQREEADAEIRRELSENRSDMKTEQATILKEMGTLVSVLKFGKDRIEGKPADASGISLNFSDRKMKDAAWRTAAATGVLAYMDYGHVQKYAVAYRSQQEFETVEAETLDDFVQLIAYVVENGDPNAVSVSDLKEAMPKVRQTLARLGAMRDLSTIALNSYDDALK